MGDMLKGLLPVLVVKFFNVDVTIIALVAVGAFLGHLFPLFFKFKGGKGVATFFGALIGIDWQAGAAALVTWLLIAYLFKYSSLAAVLTAIFSLLLISGFSPALLSSVVHVE